MIQKIKILVHGIIDKHQLSKPNAKNCKESWTLSELPNCNKIRKPLACPHSMQMYRYSLQEATEQPKGKDLQRTLHPIRAHQTQSNPEVRRCRVSVLNRINSTLPLSLFFKNHTEDLHEQPEGFLVETRGRIYRLPPLPPTSQQPINRIIDDSMTR